MAHSFLVIQLFIVVVLKHWIRIKPRNGRMVMERGGGVIYMQYTSLMILSTDCMCTRFCIVKDTTF